MRLRELPEELAVCRLAPGSPAPPWVRAGDGLCSLTWTDDEFSVVCPAAAVPAGVRAETGWRALVVEGPLDMALTGILARLATPLAEAGVAIFALSTFDTDYVLVRAAALEAAGRALAAAGHEVAAAG